MSQHTPGPWRADYIGGSTWHINYAHGTEANGDRLTGNIAVVDGKRGETGRVNARLITQAPAMQEALERVREKLGRLRTMAEHGNDAVAVLTVVTEALKDCAILAAIEGA